MTQSQVEDARSWLWSIQGSDGTFRGIHDWLVGIVGLMVYNFIVIGRRDESSADSTVTVQMGQVIQYELGGLQNPATWPLAIKRALPIWQSSKPSQVN